MPRHYTLTTGPTILTITHTLWPQSIVMSTTFTTPPPSIPGVIISSPAPYVLLVTLNRPKQLNALRREMHWRLDELWKWYDNEPKLRCAVLTGKGRAFCAGADLKEWNEKKEDEKASRDKQQKGGDGGKESEEKIEKWTDNGFGGVSNRKGKKPIIAAVNGLCLGGGFEMAINCDLVLSSPTAKFALPEVTRGVVAIAGALPRLSKVVGRQRASEMALLGRMYSPEQMLTWGVVNRIVGGEKEQGKDGEEEVVDEAISWASEMAGNSPDAVIVSREGILGAWEGEGVKEGTGRVEGGEWYRGLEEGENMREGTRSFVERRRAVWVDSKL